MKKIAVVILAAGEGTRMKSDTPKVLHKVGGVPMLGRVLAALEVLKPAKLCVVVGHHSEKVKKEFAGKNIVFVEQARQLGSGHALMQAAKTLKAFKGDVLVLCGDAPLIKAETLREFVSFHGAQGNEASVLSSELDNPFGYGRILRHSSGQVAKIVEEKDASLPVKRIREINSGIYCFKSPALWKVLGKIKNNNAKKEYYLTDSIAILNALSRPVGAYKIRGVEEILGVNSRVELAKAEAVLRKRALEKIMAEGVTVLDPANTYISPETTVGRDSVIYPGTIVEGASSIGAGSVIGPNAFIKNSKIGSFCEVRISYIYDSEVSDGVKIGPFAHIRPGTLLKENARIGNFTEIKKSVVGRGTKVSHLAYIGDTELGVDINVGAGAITCNYDGVNKHKTYIGDGSFVGSNVNLVAPVKIGKNVLIAAGSTITEDVPAGTLAIARTRQIIKPRKKRG
ncbi:MAG TPA: bifunctional UDP-N-acetylglucosamine diphosphorylase/glucosamine-1-phosphate N-acetyltransferase GlmU [Elusimicrobia bacterium]|nr:MAG: UDP-N-acetylglucosamine diphosphorylase/glucosamine-1-phosphate N-acetyltransferase [Elusimicrobia bacterium RIFOXYA12_FULL_49_49]OGS11527.1 MAG: UDP-N-acetylglucosamine diphosphorylase/glucosamine-1-phosphate N-acetyltransferase [Elusimicrobia bacterium RIFOXYB1_FULL_48_9]OGS16273.1 MAG: UDP-N-acetylglucosamine diphosphorylase/glucosamine-1-phosphate N-acetyltransferase [Elusimicrobia bacterium RIFOXYA2_FULL_47_53]OGS26185.1 MAG: UDP-N-acetylglucosamine diphosphorylase/glucosamine-1-pho